MIMAENIIALRTADLQKFFPKDYRREAGSDFGTVYTLAFQRAFGVEVPYFKDPAHLAAWVSGFAACNNLTIINHVEGDN